MNDIAQQTVAFRLLAAMLGTAGLASVILMLLILGRLTKRWESVTRVVSHYHLFYLASALVSLAAFTRLVRIAYLIDEHTLQLARTGSATDRLGSVLSPFTEAHSWFYLAFYHLPLVIAMTQSHPAHKGFWIKDLDKNMRQIELTAFPIIGQSGRISAAVAIFWEVPHES